MTGVSSCSDCAFWQRVGPQTGNCRRRAPNPSDSVDQIAHWPMTSAHERCGDGVLRGEAAPALVTCGACVFWQSNPTGGLDPQNRRDARVEWWREAGHCVRHSPSPSSEAGARGFWRASHERDCCAEGQARSLGAS